MGFGFCLNGEVEYAVHGRKTELRMTPGRSVLALVACAVGYANPGHFATAFRRRFGVNPGAYLREPHALPLAGGGWSGATVENRAQKEKSP